MTQPDRPRGRGQRVTEAPVKALAIQHELPVIQPEQLTDPAVADTLRSWQPDIGVVVAYGRIIPDSLLEIPRFGMINVHASLLPKYRGAAPIHRAVIDGETMTGVTIMRVATRLDSGDMFAKATRPIAPDETSDVVERDLSDLGARLLLDVLDSIETGTAIEEKQDHTMATLAPKITRDDGAIDWSLPASSIHNRVRGLYPWPHAFTYLDRSRLIILRTKVESESATASPAEVGPDGTGHGDRRLAGRDSGRDRPGRATVDRRGAARGQATDAGARLPGWTAAAGRRAVHDVMTAPARVAAFHALRAVENGSSDLPSALARSRQHLQDDRDRALAADIVAGTLRWQRSLDHLILHFAKRPLHRLDAEVVTILRLSLYQLLHLTRVPGIGCGGRCRGYDAGGAQTERDRLRQRGTARDHPAEASAPVATAAGRHERCGCGARLPRDHPLASGVAGPSLDGTVRLRRHRTMGPIRQRGTASDAAREPAEGDSRRRAPHPRG